MNMLRSYRRLSLWIGLFALVSLSAQPQIGFADMECGVPPFSLGERPELPSNLDPLSTDCSVCSDLVAEYNALVRIIQGTSESLDSARLAVMGYRREAVRVCRQMQAAEAEGGAERDPALRLAFDRALTYIDVFSSSARDHQAALDESLERRENLLAAISDCEKQYCESVVGEPGSGILFPAPGDNLEPIPPPPPPLPLLPDIETLTHCPACQEIVDQYNDAVGERNELIQDFNSLQEQLHELNLESSDSSRLKDILARGISDVMKQLGLSSARLWGLMTQLENCEAEQCPATLVPKDSQSGVSQPAKKSGLVTVQGRVALASPTELNTDATHIQVTVSPVDFDFSETSIEFVAPSLYGRRERNIPSGVSREGLDLFSKGGPLPMVPLGERDRPFESSWAEQDTLGPPYWEIPVSNKPVNFSLLIPTLSPLATSECGAPNKNCQPTQGEGETPRYEFEFGDGVALGDSESKVQHIYNLDTVSEVRVTLGMRSSVCRASATGNEEVRCTIPNYPVFLDTWKEGFNDQQAKLDFQRTTGQPVVNWIPWHDPGLDVYDMISQWLVPRERHQAFWGVPGVSHSWIDGEHDPETNVAPAQGLSPETWPVNEEAAPAPHLFLRKNQR